MISSPFDRSASGFRSAGIVLAVVAVVAGTIYFGRAIRGPLTASQYDVAIPSRTPNVARETQYPQPLAIEWAGVIDGMLAGGQGYVVRRTDTGERFQAYLPIGETSSISEGPVRVIGRVTGISCAYADTVFNGQCTQSVDIDTLEQLPIMLVQ